MMSISICFTRQSHTFGFLFFNKKGRSPCAELWNRSDTVWNYRIHAFSILRRKKNVLSLKSPHMSEMDIYCMNKKYVLISPVKHFDIKLERILFQIFAFFIIWISTLFQTFESRECLQFDNLWHIKLWLWQLCNNFWSFIK